MRDGLEGITSESAVSRAVSDRPAFTSPAFQFLLSAGGDVHAPRTEGGLDLRDYPTQVALDQTPTLA